MYGPWDVGGLPVGRNVLDVDVQHGRAPPADEASFPPSLAKPGQGTASFDRLPSVCFTLVYIIGTN